MNNGRTLAKWRRAVVRILKVFAQPVRGRQPEDGLVIKTNRGYGSRTEVFLIGQVFRQSRRDALASEDSLLDQLRDVRRRITRWAVSGTRVIARSLGTQERVRTDQDGYFRVHLKPREVPPSDTVWHTIDLWLEDKPMVRAQGSIFIPTDGCRCLVISDVATPLWKQEWPTS